MQSDSNLRETLRSIDHKVIRHTNPCGEVTGLQTMCYPSIMCREIRLRRLPMCA